MDYTSGQLSIPHLLISLAITMFSYGFFPLLFAKLRKSPISNLKYNVICYIVNFLVQFVFFVIIYGKTSGNPYILWTLVFTSIGTKILKNKGILKNSNKSIPVSSTIQNVDTNSAEHIEKEDFLNAENNTDISSTIETNISPYNQICTNPSQKTADKTQVHCKKCGFVIDYYTKKCTGCGKQYFRAKSMLPLFILLIFLIASIGLNIFQYLELRNISSLLSTHTSKTSSLEEKISNLNSTISEQKSTIYSLEEKADYFDDICKEYRSSNIGYAANNFKSNESIIFLSKNETDRKFTLTANWPNGGLVDIEYSGNSAYVSFDSETWSTSTKMSIIPRREGVTGVTFSNDVDSNTFKVIIVVYD